MKIKKIMLLIFIPGTHYLWWAGLILISLRCDTTEPPHSKASLSLTLEDVSCTEAWLTLKSTNLQIPNSIVLTQNNQARLTINLTTTDTLLYIDSLLPNQTYKFQSVIPAGGGQAGSQSAVRSNELSVTTMDTTFHNFTWQTFTFGQHSSSVLYDVAIINENNIWAVGEIYMNDSLGQPDPIAYNAVHWDGGEWKVKKIDVLFRGSLITPPLEGVFAFSSTDIWFVGSLPIHGDGTNWVMYDLRTTVDPNLSLSKAWGANPSNIYFVGRNGSIAHYQNGVWKKIESGTKLNIGDIWGVWDRNSGYIKYLAAGEAMLKVNQQSEIEEVKLEPNIFINLLWGMTNNLIYTAGNGVVLYKNNKWEKIDRPDINTAYGVRGSNYNNVFCLSTTLNILHFNGYTWQAIDTDGVNIYYRLEVKNNLAVSVGWQGDKATLTLLNKN